MTVTVFAIVWALLGQVSGAPAEAPAAKEDTVVNTSEGDVRVSLPPGTKSVLKQPPAANGAGSTTTAATSGSDGTGARTNYDAPLVQVPNRTRVNDPNVRQAQATQTVDNQTAAETAEAANASAQAATDLVTQALTAPKDSALAGRPSTLFEMLSRAGMDRSRMLAITKAYWKLSTAQADHNWAIDELAKLDRIPAERGLERALLTTAQAAAQARLHEARVGAVTAQQELADLIGVPAGTQQPLAADLPLVGPYRTYFDSIFAGRVPPPRTKAIDRGLSGRRDAIDARVAAVHAASTAAHLAEDARNKGQLDLQSLLNCHAELARQRRALLISVRDYNEDIGEYAIAVADPSAGLNTLVAMMIVVKNPAAQNATTPRPKETASDPAFSRTVTDELLMQPAAPANSKAPNK